MTAKAQTPIDVLAVLSASATRLHKVNGLAGYQESVLPDRVDQARAAIAELIEAHRALLTFVDDRADAMVIHADVHPGDLNAVLDRGNAALANVSGGAL